MLSFVRLEDIYRLTSLDKSMKPYFWEELTAADFEAAVRDAKGVCLVPIGCMEKHGNQLPLGTDVLIAREICRRAASEVPAVVFPFNPFGHIVDGLHRCGSIALRTETLVTVLEDLCSELARNGLPKIVFLNGHGGNQPILNFLLRKCLGEPKPYTLYLPRTCGLTVDEEKEFAAMLGREALPECGHACVWETSLVMALRPDLVHMDRVVPEETHRLDRLRKFKEAGVQTSVDWYADYPAHIAGDPAGASPELGEWSLAHMAGRLVTALRLIRDDETTPALLEEYYRLSKSPER